MLDAIVAEGAGGDRSVLGALEDHFLSDLALGAFARAAFLMHTSRCPVRSPPSRSTAPTHAQSTDQASRSASPTLPLRLRRAADAEALAACIPLRLAPGGTAVLCSDEKRAPLKLCGELLRKRGFVVEDSVLTLTVAPDVGAATTHRVRVVRAISPSSVGAS